MKKLWQAFRAVCAAAFGVRGQTEHKLDAQQIPLSLWLISGAIGSALFVILLLGWFSLLCRHPKKGSRDGSRQNPGNT